jgi:hypothetical protein
VNYFCPQSLLQNCSTEIQSTISAPGIDEKGETVVDLEAITQHIETYNFIDEEELKDDVDIAVVALRGQDLTFTEESKFIAIFNILVF